MSQARYALKGLCCAHCAGRIEREVRALPYVLGADINLVAQTIRIELSGGEREIEARLKSIVRSHEPSVQVYRLKENAAAEETEAGRREWLAIALGLGLLLAALLLKGAYPALSLPVYVAAYLVCGGGVLLRAARGIAGGRVFDENFLMAAATLGAFAVGEYAEAVVVMLLYRVGEAFQKAAVRRARRSIRALTGLRPDTARVLENGRESLTPPERVPVGALVQVRPGERVPLDGVVTEGVSALDLSVLTGESLPRAVCAGDEAPAGAVCRGSPFCLRVTRPAAESTAERIIRLVEGAARHKAPAENFITAFSRWYTPAVVGLAALLAAVPPLALGAPFALWLERALVFLVISCPCALVISVPLSYFSGISLAGGRGVLVKGSNYLDVLGQLTQVVFDKTGTLTHGRFEVRALHPAPGVDEQTLLSVAAHAEAYANHPAAAAIVRACPAVNKARVQDFEETAGRGVRALVDGRPVMAGSAGWLRANGVECAVPDEAGVAVCVAEGARPLGCIVCRDALKDGARQAVQRLRGLGVRSVSVLTGDSRENTEEVSRGIGADETFAGLMPEDKLRRLLALKKRGKTAFVGDGVNDAPVLAAADVGIAMGALGADAAIEAADVVLLSDELDGLPEAVDIARRTRRIVRQNIVFALGVKALALAMGALGMAGLWEAVFADVGVSMLAVMNALRLMLKHLQPIH